MRRTAADLLVNYLAYRPERDHSFDDEFATDTGGSVQPSELGIAQDFLREKAILYLPSPPQVTAWMLEHVELVHEQYSFVDLGCGKGRVLLVASRYPFIAVHGVEISAQLSRIARKNAEIYLPSAGKCQNVLIHNVDATTFVFPLTPLLIHLYHPFDLELTATILGQLAESLQQAPRHVVIAYLVYTSAVPQVEALFATFPWLKRTRYEHSLTGQYDWLFYSN